MDADHGLTITWIGHATVVIEIGGRRLITDPALTGRLAHLTRRGAAATVGPVDAVLISHVHLDHLHVPSLRRPGRVPEMAVPTGAARLVRRVAPDRLVELRAGDSWDLDGVGGPIEVRAVAADHSGRRGPHSRVEVEPLGFVARAGGRGVYFAGDTDLFDGMADLGPVDVALVPIWGLGAVARRGPPQPGHRRPRRRTDRSAVRRADPLGHLPSAARAGRRPDVVRGSARPVPRRAHGPRPRRSPDRPPTGRIADLPRASP